MSFEQLYWLCSGIGFLFVAGSAFFGHLDADGGHLDAGGHDLGGHDVGGHDAGAHDAGAHDGGGHGDGHDSPQSSHRSDLVRTASMPVVSDSNRRMESLYFKLVGLLSPLRLMLFIFFFGAMGIVTLKVIPAAGVLSVVPAILAGWFCSSMLLKLMGRMLSRLNVSNSYRIESAVGSVGELTIPISAGETGEVMLVMKGSRVCGRARCDNGSLEIAKFAKVIIMDVRDGVYYVEPWDDETGSVSIPIDQKKEIKY